jgi:hypothetical protein
MTEIPQNKEPATLYLLKGSIRGGRLDDSWNDFSYRTRYTLQYCDSLLHMTEIGTAKIGEFNMGGGQYFPNLPLEFMNLNRDRFFSVGENENYYKNISQIPEDKGYDILLSLNDFTLCQEVYEKAKQEEVTLISLLREFGADCDNHINGFYEILRPPLNLNTMKRVFGSTGWDDVDCGLLEMQRLLFGANIRLYYNAIATIGREIIKGIADKLYDDDLHRSITQYPNAPTADQFIIKLHSFVDYLALNNEISNNLRSYIKSTIELVQGYVHKENADKYECFMCVHAVTALVFQLSIINDRDRYNEFVGQ